MSKSRGLKLIDLGLRFAGKDISVTMLGNVVRSLCRSVAAVLVMAMGPEKYGLFGFASQWFYVGTEVADFGMDTAGVRYGARFRKEGREDEGRALLRVLLWTKIVMALLVMAAGWVAAGWVGPMVLGPASVWPIRIALCGVIGRLLFTYCSTYFKARQAFIRNAAAVAAVNMLLLSGILILWRLDSLQPSSALAVYSMAPLIAFLIFFSSPWIKLGPEPVETRPVELFGRMVRFSRFIFIVNVAASLRTRVLYLFIAAWATGVELGHYAAGDRVATILSLVSTSILTTLIPKASTKIKPEQIRRFLKSTTMRATLVALPLFLVIPFTGPAMRVLGSFSAKIAAYQDAVPVLNLVYAGILFSIISLPVRSVLYGIGRPQVESVTEVGMALAVIAAGGFVVPRYGIVGAAAIMFVQRLLNCIILLVYAYVRIYNDPAAGSSDEDGFPRPPEGEI